MCITGIGSRVVALSSVSHHESLQGSRLLTIERGNQTEENGYDRAESIFLVGLLKTVRLPFDASMTKHHLTYL